MKYLITLALIFSPLFASAQDSTAPDLRKLSEIGKIIHSEQNRYPTDKGWLSTTKLMKEVDVFDQHVKRMMSVFCGNEVNKSVLVVGEPSDTYKYLFARLAKMATPAGCKRMSHVDISTSKLQGYMYVGTTERQWRDYIEKPSYNKDAILYFDNLALLIGIGTSMNRTVGIESTYVSDFKAGKLKTVAFLNKYDYRRLLVSRHGYVINGFQEVIEIDDLKMHQVDALARKFLEINAPHIKISNKVAQYLYRNVQYYQPNLLEPQRTMNVLLSLIRKNQMKLTKVDAEIKVVKPYTANMNQEFIIDRPDSVGMQLVFDCFNTESGPDKLRIYNAHDEALLDEFSGQAVDLITKRYDTNKIRLQFVSDSSVQKEGFKIKNLNLQKMEDVILNLEMVRTAIMEIVQVPKWIMNRDYDVVRNLPRELDADVVGVHEGKKALIKQVKIGYVSGRTDEKPAGSLLLTGPTGTGKSYIARKAAEFLDMKIITLDMTQYRTDATFDRFLDAVADNLILYPYAIYLFEEIDKANPRVLDSLFFMMDEGIFYDKTQRPLFARGALVLMTTNAGGDLIIRERNNPDLRRLVNLELQKVYRPSFLNRFDSIPIFTPFTEPEFHQLATIMVKKKIKKMKEYFDWNLTVDAASINFLGAEGGSDLYGARPMERIIENLISVGISEYQINRDTIEYGSTISITKVRGEKTRFKINVNGDTRGGLNYEIDLDNNSGLIPDETTRKLNEMFAKNRLY